MRGLAAEADRLGRERDKAIAERDEVLAALDGGLDPRMQMLLTFVDGEFERATRERDETRAVVERVRALAAEWEAIARRACDGAAHGDGCPDCNGTAYEAELRAALDGGTEAGRATGGPVPPGAPLVGTEWPECFVPGVHVHRWAEQTSYDDGGKPSAVCTVDGCGETREEGR
jgi:hypothetical protein